MYKNKFSSSIYYQSFGIFFEQIIISYKPITIFVTYLKTFFTYWGRFGFDSEINQVVSTPSYENNAR